MIEIEELHGKTVQLLLVRFLMNNILDDSEVRRLFGLIEDLSFHNLIMDLGRLNCVSDHFFARLIGVQKRIIKQTGRMVLVIKPGTNLDGVFDVCRLRANFSTYVTVEEALSSF